MCTFRDYKTESAGVLQGSDHDWGISLGRGIRLQRWSFQNSVLALTRPVEHLPESVAHIEGPETFSVSGTWMSPPFLFDPTEWKQSLRSSLWS